MVALLGCALVYLQQLSYAGKTPHKDYAGMEFKDCNSCHKSEGVAPTHDSDWVRGHRLVAGRAGAKCNECHRQSWCLDCHQGGGSGDRLDVGNFGRDYKPKSHRSDFINLHPIKAKESPQQCLRCHDRTYCNECHSRFPKGSLRIKSHLPSGSGQSYIWSSEHASEARRDLQSCQACHPEGDVCLKCHGARTGAKINPHPKSFKGGNIRERSDRSCRKCH